MFNDENSVKNLKARKFKNSLFHTLFLISTLFGVFILGLLLFDLIIKAVGWLDWQFINSFDSRMPEKSGMIAGIMGSLWLMMITAPLSFILGVATAIYLEEYAKKNWINQLIETNISNLAGVPSIVYGLLGLAIFVRYLGFDRSVLSAALTLTLLILPVIIVSAQEAIRAVPNSLRNASYALGAGKWKTIVRVVLPSSIPGILTGSILSVSRAIGETAPLIIVGAVTFTASLPSSVFDTFTAMPIQIYNWTSLPKEEFQHVAAAGILILLLFLLSINALAIFIRNKFQNKF
jgi:phosphate transport system permease protein